MVAGFPEDPQWVWQLLLAGDHEILPNLDKTSSSFLELLISMLQTKPGNRALAKMLSKSGWMRQPRVKYKDTDLGESRTSASLVDRHRQLQRATFCLLQSIMSKDDLVTLKGLIDSAIPRWRAATEQQETRRIARINSDETVSGGGPSKAEGNDETATSGGPHKAEGNDESDLTRDTRGYTTNLQQRVSPRGSAKVHAEFEPDDAKAKESTHKSGAIGHSLSASLPDDGPLPDDAKAKESTHKSGAIIHSLSSPMLFPRKTAPTPEMFPAGHVMPATYCVRFSRMVDIINTMGKPEVAMKLNALTKGLGGAQGPALNLHLLFETTEEEHGSYWSLQQKTQRLGLGLNATPPPPRLRPRPSERELERESMKMIYVPQSM